MKSSIIWGLIVIFIGTVLLLNNFGVTDISIGEILTTFWPVVFIIWGIETMGDAKNKYRKNDIIWGLLLIALGAGIIARNLDLIEFDFSIIWNLIFPLILIYIGISIFRGGKISNKGQWAVMSAIEKSEANLENTQYTAFMGAVELDLRNTEIPEGETYMDLTAIMGAVEVKLNPDINYIFTNNTFLGGIEFFNNESGGILLNKKYEHIGNEESNKTVIINTRCIMGAIEID
ncbi:LiaF transmembrane domain-containing protein [Natronospora cellulosivora (SeqCode)]